MNSSDVIASGPGRALLSLLLVLGGGMLYMALLTVPWVRSTGGPTFILMGIGLVLGASAWRRDRRAVGRLIVGLDVVLVAIFVGYFFVFARLPEVVGVNPGDLAPQFVATDHRGQQVALVDALRQGPVLLVFYRGHW